MSDYSEKLKNPKWQRKRLEILNRDNFTCCACGDTETELHVHHLKYTKEPHEAPNEDLQTLCKHCHSILEFFIDVTSKRFELKISCFKQEKLIGVRVSSKENNYKNNLVFIFVIQGNEVMHNSLLDLGIAGNDLLNFLNKPNG